MNTKSNRGYKNPQMNLRIPTELKEKIQQLANNNNRSMNAEILFILESYVDDYFNRDPKTDQILKSFFARLDEHLKKRESEK